MPYQFLPASSLETRLRLWPHRSLTKGGFVWFIGATAALIALPLIALLGNPALWVLLPFLIAAIAAIWAALARSDRDGCIVEELVLTPTGSPSLATTGKPARTGRPTPTGSASACMRPAGRCRTT